MTESRRSENKTTIIIVIIIIIIIIIITIIIIIIIIITIITITDCNCFLKRLTEKLSEKNEEPYHITITWIRTSLSFEILRSVLMHMRKRS